MEEEKGEKKPDNTEASSSKPFSSVKQTPKTLKPRPKIVKNSPKLASTPLKIVKTPPGKKANEGNSSAPQAQGGSNKKKKRKNIIAKGNKESDNNGMKEAKKPNLKKDEEEKKVAELNPIENDPKEQKPIEKDPKEQKPIEKDPKEQKIDTKIGMTEKGRPNQKKKGKKDRSNKHQRHGKTNDVLVKNLQHGKNKDVLDKNVQNGKNKGKWIERHRENDKRKDEIAGLIFMCNTSTKPDCFHYRVMGVTMGKKDLVLGIKPGIRLFLYDFDRKLMYGIYKATSPGGMKLEPAAFGGAFPVQVRFDVHQDCYPLPESAFKSAIKENYDEKHKFKTELTLQQVRRLVDLFRPAEGPSNGQHMESPVPRSVRHKEAFKDHRDSRRSPSRNDDRGYHGRPRQIEDRVSYRPESSRREELPHDSFLSEQEYRTYGLQGQRRDRIPSHLVSTVEPHQSSRESDQLLRHPPLIYREAMPSNEPPPLLYRETAQANEHLLGHPSRLYRETARPQNESIRNDPYFISEKEYQTYGLRREIQPQIPPATAITGPALDSYLKSPYYSHNYADLYLQPPVTRDEVPSSSYLLDHHKRAAYLAETDHALRIEEDQMGRLVGVPDYNLGRVQLQDTKPEATFAPVSSRYSFAGPSSTYR